jgi:hypothetical protein
MPKKRPDPKSAPGLVCIRLQVTAAERDRLRVVAAASEHRTMAIWCREKVREAMRREGGELDGKGGTG